MTFNVQDATAFYTQKNTMNVCNDKQNEARTSNGKEDKYKYIKYKYIKSYAKLILKSIII